MTESNAPRLKSLIPQPPVHEEAEVFSRRMGGLMDGQPKDDATVSQALSGMDEMLDVIAAGLYNLASMLVGEGEEGVQLVETAVADAHAYVAQAIRRAPGLGAGHGPLDHGWPLRPGPDGPRLK